ncbi:Uncharacterized protein APZ42_029786 [Daphnia magna]|uniref:Uncharacterized protein n=1 Tax=Daphnia magna TaxID=35525 RepID=A0A164PB53_9CRUS|nr:Uncharacterized protein APZ42_029786 [Daphnia magna]
MLQQPSPHGLQQQQHQPSDDLYSSDLVHHHSGHHQQQQIQQQQHPHHSSAASLPMDLHLPQGYPFYTTSQTVNSNATRKSGLEDFVSGHHHPNSGLHSGFEETSFKARWPAAGNLSQMQGRDRKRFEFWRFQWLQHFERVGGYRGVKDLPCI